MGSPSMKYAAPCEAWLTENQASKTTPGGVEVKLRYLRADLTCGECKNQNSWMDCAHNEDEYDRPLLNDSPACMAFTPKEER